ncbi:trypsin-like cysteine/serine peptidase domain-containing protein [Tribonema minus]|uniref:Trypsin-like cysteine/serine peptidase domain-containing protein n=1 Tax=Tribonema minus TaxID=303371 RepID=A0A835Z3D2_9STRA|nr:trypsin-like cysteine/serine peptidase domain-containing protein [Tribonema minus]
MDRFKNEGFVLSAFESFATKPLPRALPSNTTGNKRKMLNNNFDNNFKAASPPRSAVRVTREGYVYRTTPLRTPPALNVPDFVPARSLQHHNDGSGGVGNAGGDGGSGSRSLRELLIFGTDSRTEITDPAAQEPYSAIGQLISAYNATDDEAFLCSGTLVGTDAVLTAGHCVYGLDADTGEYAFMSAAIFNPSLIGDDAPFGTFPILYQTTFSEWTDSGAEDFNFDMAVLRLDVAPDTGRSAFDTIGYHMGVSKDACNMPAVKLSGYPGDKNSTMWASGTCSDINYSCGGGTAITNCDWVEGDSGSALFGDAGADTGTLAYGVVSHHTVPGGAGLTASTVSSGAWPDVYNSLTMMTADKYDDVYSWITSPLAELEQR